MEGQSSAYGVAIPAGAFVVGFVGNLHLAKGIFELLEAARILKARGADVHYLIVGSSPRADTGLLWSLLNMAGIAQEQQSAFIARLKETGLEERFHFTGHTPEIGQHVMRMNVLTFPTHFDTCGRPVFEAAFYECPSIVAVSDPKPDTLDDGVTGLAIAKPDPELLADAIAQMMADPERTRAMGQAARALAVRNFTPSTNAAQLYALYQQVAAGRAQLVTHEPL
jgi:glycosyltransferase involved in cell wall biosynthesis